jgi:hypothetical protein
MLREYRYRQLFPISHEVYLEEPATMVTWLLEIDRVYREAQNG